MTKRVMATPGGNESVAHLDLTLTSETPTPTAQEFLPV